MPGLPAIIHPPADMPIVQVAMLQATIRDAWVDYLRGDGDPGDTEEFWEYMTGSTP